MHRLNLVLSASIALGAVAALEAAPPTEDNWWMGVGRYTGDFHLSADGSDAPIGKFSMRWVKPFEVSSYTYLAAGDQAQTNTGFCMWNDATKRAEFTEVEQGSEGRVIYQGYCSDMTPTSMTWTCRCWSEQGEIRQFTVTDTMDANGNLGRTMKVTKGTPTPVNFVKWIRTNDFLEQFAGAADFVGTWRYQFGDTRQETVIEWGPGRRSLLERDYRVGKDGTRVLSATCTYMIDEETGELYAHYTDNQGLSAWANPTVTTDGSTHTMTADWQGTANGGSVGLTTVSTLKGRGDTLTNTMDDFEVDGAALPAGPLAKALSKPVTMTRVK